MNEIEQQRKFKSKSDQKKKRLYNLLVSKHLADLEPSRCPIAYSLITLAKLPIF